MSWLERLLRRGAGAPPRSPSGDPLRVAQVEALLEEIAPLVAADGGRIELEAIDGGLVVVRLRGACAGCLASEQTLRGALEPLLRSRLEWFERLEGR